MREMTDTMPMNTNTHAAQRVTERLTDAGYDQATIDKVYWAAEQLAKQSKHTSEAIKMLDLIDQVNQAWGDRSNGNQVWAIVRNCKLITVMLRRSTQPATASALKVEKVTII